MISMQWNLPYDAVGIHVNNTDERPLASRPFEHVLFNDGGKVRARRRTDLGFTDAAYYDPESDKIFFATLAGFSEEGKVGRYASAPRDTKRVRKLTRVDEGVHLVYQLKRRGIRLEKPYAVTWSVADVIPLQPQQVPDALDAKTVLKQEYERRQQKALPLREYLE